MVDNNFGDIQDNFGRITEILDSMRLQNTLNSDTLDKVLNNINLKLENLSDEDNSDLIKVFLAELKKNLDERHNFVSSKFTEMEDSVKLLAEKAENQIAGSELKEIFDIIATNLNAFSKEAVAQKELLSEISFRVEDIKQDDSAKTDILKNISVLKVELEKFNNGFQSIIVNLNDNFKAVSQALVKVDSHDALESLKQDIENIFLSSNAVLSTLQIIDHKNRELEDTIKNLVSKEDFEVERQQVANLILQGDQLNHYVSKLPDKAVLETLTEKVDTTVGVVNALRNVLIESSDQNQQMLVAQLENLESKILNISSEEEFIGFRKELSEFASGVMQSTNLIRTDLLDTSAELKNLFAFLNTTDMKSSFQGVSETVRESEANVKDSILNLSGKISQEASQNKNIVTSEINGGLQKIADKMDVVEGNITETSKSNLTVILENIQSVVSNIFSMKTEMNVDNLQNIQTLDEKVKEIKDDVVSSKNVILTHSQQKFENISSNIDEMSEKIDFMRSGLNQASQENFDNVLSTVEKLSEEFLIIKESLNQDSRDNAESILSNIIKLSQELVAVKDTLGASVRGASQNILSNVESLSASLVAAKEGLSDISRENAENILSSITNLSQELVMAKDTLGNSSKESAEGILSNIETLSEALMSVKESFNDTSKENAENILLNISRLSKELISIKGDLAQIVQENSANNFVLVEDLSKEVLRLKEFVNQNSHSNLQNVREVVGELSQELVSVKETFAEASRETSEAVLSHVERLSEEFSGVKESLSQDSKDNLEYILSNISNLSQELVVMKDGLGNSSKAASQRILSNVESLSEALMLAKEGLSDISKDNAERILSNISSLSQELINVKEVLDDSSRTTTENISANFEKLSADLSDEFSFIKDSLSQDSRDNVENILSNIFKLSQEFDSIKGDLAQNLQENSANNFSLVEDLSKEILSLKEFVSQNSQLNLQNVKSVIGELSQGLDALKGDLENNSQARFDAINSSFQALSERVEDVKDSLSVDLKENLLNLQSTVLSLPYTIKENQVGFEDEKKILIEQNSKSIEDLGVKIQSLIKGILSKDNPFKEEVVFEFGNLNVLLTKIQEELTQENSKVGEEIKLNIQKIEELINQSADSYDVSLHNVQTKLVEYLQLIKETTDASDLKLENSIKEVVEIKSEIKSISENVSALNTDSKVSDLSMDINKKFEGILLNITQLEQIASSKSQDNLQKTFDTLEDHFEKVLANLEEYKNASNGSSFELVEKFSEKLEDIQEHINASSNDIFVALNKKTSEIVNGFDPVKETIELLAQVDFDKIFLDIKSQIESSNASLAEALMADLKPDNTVILQELSESFKSLSSKLEKAQFELSEKSSDEIDELKTILEGISLGVENIPDSINSGFSTDEIIDKIDGLEKDLIQAQEDIKENFDKKFTESADLIRDNLEEMVSIKSDILDEINSTQNIIKEESSSQITSIKTEMEELVNEITKSQDELSSYKLDIAELLKIRDEEAVEQLASIENSIIDEISQNVEGFKSVVKTSAQQMEGKLSLIEGGYKESTQALLSEIKSSFYEKVEDNLDELKSFIEVITNNTDYNSAIENLKSDVYEKFSILADDIEASVKKVNVKKDLDELRQNVEDSTKEVLEDLYERLLMAFDDNASIQDLIGKSEEFERRIEDLKRTVSEDVVEKLESFGIDIDRQKQEFSNFVEEIKTSLNDFKETYTDLSLNSSMEISSFMTNVQEKIDSVDKKLDDYDFGSVIESAKTDLMKEISSVKESFAEINYAEELSEEFKSINQKLDLMAIEPKVNIADELSEEFQGINQKLDLMALESDDNLESDIEAIKNTIDSQNKFLKDIKGLEQLDKLSKIDGIETVQSEIKKIISQFEEQLNKVSKEAVEDKDQVAEITKELKTLKQDVLESLLNVFDQISFVEEAEDIKDFVAEKAEETKSEIADLIEKNLDRIKSDIKNLSGIQSGELDSDVKSEINDAIKSSLGNNFEEIISSLDMLHDKTNEFDGSYKDVKNDICEVKKHLQILNEVAINNEDDFSDYSYTLQDVESDIAKVRLILNDLVKAKAESAYENADKSVDFSGDLEKLNEDIMSISTRTNKLLLTSDESYNTLKENLSDFRNIVYQLEEKVRYLDNTESNKRMEQKLEGINNLVLSSVKSDKTFNQAFTYLAQWVDDAGSSISSIADKVEKVSEIDEIKGAVFALEKSMPKKADIESILNEVSDKFDRQQETIQALEEKIEKLSNKMSKAPSSIDVRSIVEEVLSHVETSAADAKLTKKVDNIDKQLVKLSKNIDKITSYVDEV